MFYIEQPDILGHYCGPNHPILNKKIKELDDVTKYLHQRLKSQGLDKRVNVVHTADHGLLPVTKERIIKISDILDPDTYWSGDSSPFVYITPKEGKSAAGTCLNI